MKLSVVIPAHNEEACVERTVRELDARLNAEGIEREILVINDNSSDRTEDVLRHLQPAIPCLTYINNPPPSGFGLAVRKGLEHFTGDAVAIYMADASDRPEDLVRFFRILQERGVGCVCWTSSQ